MNNVSYIGLNIKLAALLVGGVELSVDLGPVRAQLFQR